MGTQAQALRVKTLISKEEFIRKAWIGLANEDAPLEVFKENFGEVSINEHQVFVETISADISYQASIGYDRQEPYTDFETYYENEPYTDYETYYENGVKRQRAVTKHRRVAKQRQVTRYRTVTDWTPSSGNHHASSTASAENNLDVVENNSEFFYTLTDADIENASGEGEITINDFAEEEVNEWHREKLYSSAYRSLPGDRSKDFDYSIDRVSVDVAVVYMCSEYEASINYGGKKFTKKVFPFGTAKVNGDTIANEVSADSFKDKKFKEFIAHEKEVKDSIPDKVWNSTKLYSLLSLALLVLSLVISFFVPVAALVVIAYAAALAMFVFSRVITKKQYKTIKENVDKQLEKEKDAMFSEVANYTMNRKAQMKEALNNKLASLGFAPASDNELM